MSVETDVLRVQLPSDLRHVDAQVVRLLLVARAPDLLQELALTDQLPRMTDEDLDEVPLGGCEPDCFVVGRDHFLRDEVHGERRGADDGFLVIGRDLAALGCPHPCEQLPHAERFRDVVVGPGIQRVHLLGLLLARRQHDDRDRGPRPEASDHLDSVDPRQP